MGPTAGGAVYSPAMTDFIFMVKNTSYMFITGPEVIKSVTEKRSTSRIWAAPWPTMKKARCGPQFACESDEDAINQINACWPTCRPTTWKNRRWWIPATTPPARTTRSTHIIPDSPNKSYDMRDVIRSIVDNGTFFEPHQHFATNILTAFARLNGRSIGIIANQPMVMAGCLDINASDKATRFIRFCDAFNIPLLTHCRRARLPARQPAGVGRHHPPRRQTALVLQ